MELVWHNCETYPPKEIWNNNLYATDGEFVFRVDYEKKYGWYDLRTFEYIPKNVWNKFWWADIQQTVRNEPKFKGLITNDLININKEKNI